MEDTGHQMESQPVEFQLLDNSAGLGRPVP